MAGQLFRSPMNYRMKSCVFACLIGELKNVPVPTPDRKLPRSGRRERAIDDSIKNADSDRSCPKCNFPVPRWRLTCRVCGYEMGRQLIE